MKISSLSVACAVCLTSACELDTGSSVPEGYGESCDIDTDCTNEALSCHGGLCLTRTPGVAGDPCVDELECAGHDLVCYENTCSCEPSCFAGQECGFGSGLCQRPCGTCDDSEVCVGGSCKARETLSYEGDRCNHDLDCQPDDLICYDGICSCRPSCDVDQECGEGRGTCDTPCGPGCLGGERCTDGQCIPRIWSDSATGLMWEVSPTDSPLTCSEAIDHCGGLLLGNQSGWRLPTIDELRSLVCGCSGTAAEGACALTEECSTYTEPSEPGCLVDCEGCTSSEGPGRGGCYWDAELRGECAEETGLYVSSTSADTEEGACWGIDFNTGAVNAATSDSRARCVLSSDPE